MRFDSAIAWSMNRALSAWFTLDSTINPLTHADYTYS
jgi:hypothetical protein